jgi:hypothetical protein
LSFVHYIIVNNLHLSVGFNFQLKALTLLLLTLTKKK